MILKSSQNQFLFNAVKLNRRIEKVKKGKKLKKKMNRIRHYTTDNFIIILTIILVVSAPITVVTAQEEEEQNYCETIQALTGA